MSAFARPCLVWRVLLGVICVIWQTFSLRLLNPRKPPQEQTSRHSGLVPTAEVDFGHRIAPAPGMARTDDAGVQSPCWEVGFQGDWIRVCRPKAGARCLFCKQTAPCSTGQKVAKASILASDLNGHRGC